MHPFALATYQHPFALQFNYVAQFVVEFVYCIVNIHQILCDVIAVRLQFRDSHGRQRCNIG